MRVVFDMAKQIFSLGLAMLGVFLAVGQIDAREEIGLFLALMATASMNSKSGIFVEQS